MGKRSIYKSDSFFSGLGGKPVEGAVVVEGNHIIAVDDYDNAGDYVNSETEVYDYSGHTIMPAFHDSHTHVIIGALMESSGFLRYAKSEDEAAKIVYEKHKDSKEKWVLGGAWDHLRWETKKLPTKDSLDRYFKDKPVLLVNRECHGAWVNSTGLKLLGIDENTVDPPYGEIYRDESGRPTGYLHETAYAGPMKEVFSAISTDVLEGLAKSFFKKAHSYGITAVSDMQIAGIILNDVYDALEKKSELGCRIHYCPPLDYPLDKMLALKEKHNSSLLKFSGAKDFVDGTPMGYTGLMVDEYSDKEGFFGSPLMDIEWMKEQVALFDKHGIRTRLHACGDMAVRVALNAFENAGKTNRTEDRRHTVEHIEVCTKQDIPRFGKLGVIAAVQPEHLPKFDFYNHPFHPILGEERIETAWPFKSIQDDGGLLGFGTDYPVSELSPFRGLYRAVTRMTDEFEPDGGFIPGEKLPLGDALKAYTYGSAYINRREDELGTLEKGKLADLVVLDKDIFKIDPKELKEIEAIKTVMDGECVYEK